VIDGRTINRPRYSIRNVGWSRYLKEVSAWSMRHVILFCRVLLKQAANQNCRMDRRSLAEVVNLMPAGNTGRLPEYPAFIDLTAGINRHAASTPVAVPLSACSFNTWQRHAKLLSTDRRRSAGRYLQVAAKPLNLVEYLPSSSGAAGAGFLSPKAG
jgi:hypothetical protein